MIEFLHVFRDGNADLIGDLVSEVSDVVEDEYKPAPAI